MSVIQRSMQGDVHVLHRAAQGTPSAYLHFAHATGFNAETYRAILSQLDPRIDAYASDLRGHGRTTLPADPTQLHSWAQYEQDLLTLLDTVPAPIVLAGHSMGGTVSLRAAAKKPERVAGVVLIEPVFANPQFAWFINAAYRWAPEHRLPLVKAAKERRRHFKSQADAVSHLAGRGIFTTWPRETLEAYIEGGMRPDREEGVTWTCDPDWESKTFAVARPMLSARVATLSCPVTLIVGGRDSTCHPKARQKIQRLLPQTRLIEVQGGSHFVPMESPALVRAEIDSVALGAQAM